MKIKGYTTYKNTLLSQYNKDKIIIKNFYEYYSDTIRTGKISILFKVFIFGPIGIILFLGNKIIKYSFMPLLTYLEINCSTKVYNINKNIIYFIESFFGVLILYEKLKNLRQKIYKAGYNFSTERISGEEYQKQLIKESTEILLKTKSIIIKYWSLIKETGITYKTLYFTKIKRFFYIIIPYIHYRIKIAPIRMRWYKALGIYRMKVLYILIKRQKLSFGILTIYTYILIGLYVIIRPIWALIVIILILILGEKYFTIIDLIIKLYSKIKDKFK